MVRKEREKDDGDIWSDVGEDMIGKSLWQEVKKRAEWTQSLSPRVLKLDGVSISKPQDMTTRLNNYFLRKLS